MKDKKVIKRLKKFIKLIWQEGGVNPAGKKMISEKTKRTMKGASLRAYFIRHGYRIVSGPYVFDKDNNRIDIDDL